MEKENKKDKKEVLEKLQEFCKQNNLKIISYNIDTCDDGLPLVEIKVVDKVSNDHESKSVFGFVPSRKIKYDNKQ